MTHPSAPTHSTGYLIEKTLSYQTSMLLWRLWRLWRQLLSLSLSSLLHQKQTAQNVLVMVGCDDKTGSGGGGGVGSGDGDGAAVLIPTNNRQFTQSNY